MSAYLSSDKEHVPWDGVPYVRLYAGGICFSEKQACSPDMQEYSMELVAFSSNESRFADLAIIQLKDDVQFGVSLRPACLPTGAANPDDSLLVTGFGWAEGSQQSLFQVSNRYSRQSKTLLGSSAQRHYEDSEG